ncbi:hypothetical protein AB0N05_15000 [Nocardia sp. NPDC051030]|uniref:hypothetical protein n=1 Tax=Nocardia sp. NPDC051030 TaxID=3155162 RepID=UPI00343A0CB5
MNTHHTPDPIDGADVVHRHWPLDGPYTAESLVAAADAMGELNRYLAHATICNPQETLPSAPGAYPLFGNLAHSTHTQGEVLQNLARWSVGLAQDPSLRHDQQRSAEASTSEHTAQVAAEAAAAELRDAADTAGQLGRQLDRVQGLIGHLYHQELDWGLDR